MDKQYNLHFKRFIELQEGEQFCSKCKGKGRVPIRDNIMLRCDICNGDGKIDWIEKVIGKKGNYIGYTFDFES